jgi:hypothetical protein
VHGVSLAFPKTTVNTFAWIEHPSVVVVVAVKYAVPGTGPAVNICEAPVAPGIAVNGPVTVAPADHCIVEPASCPAIVHVPALGVGAVKSFTKIADGPVIVPAVTVKNGCK